jgi:hypothetical protein
VRAHYLFNLVGDDAGDRAAGHIRSRMWAIGADEPHRDALAAGDLVLLYLGAPERSLIGRAELGSAWTPSGACVLLARIEAWDPPVPMSAVLAQVDRSEGARADFEHGVIRITAGEYETALRVAGRATATG